MLRRILWTLAATLLVSGLSPARAAHAAPINLILAPGPDISSSSLTTNYNAAGDSLSITGFAAELDDDGDDIGNWTIYFDAGGFIPFGDFVLNATIDSTGALSSGSLSITGYIPGLGFNSGTLLTGNLLTEFGFDQADPPQPFEFKFTVTGGDAAALYGGINAEGGLILTGHGYLGSFNADFSGSAGVSDTGTPVPEPGLPVLVALGIAFAAGGGARRRLGR